MSGEIHELKALVGAGRTTTPQRVVISDGENPGPSTSSTLMKSKQFLKFRKTHHKLIRNELCYLGKYICAVVFPMYTSNGSEIGNYVRYVYKKISSPGVFNLQVNLGFYLYNSNEDRFVYYYPNPNQNLIRRFLIRTLEDVWKVTKKLEEIDLVSFSANFAPNSCYIFVSIASVEIKLLKLS